MTQYTHTNQINRVTPSARGCEECLKVEFFEPNKDWRWCCVDRTYVDLVCRAIALY